MERQVLYNKSSKSKCRFDVVLIQEENSFSPCTFCGIAAWSSTDNSSVCEFFSVSILILFWEHEIIYFKLILVQCHPPMMAQAPGGVSGVREDIALASSQCDWTALLAVRPGSPNGSGFPRKPCTCCLLRMDAFCRP